MVGHVAPEAARGGPLAIVRDGDTISIDVDAKPLTLELDDDEIAARLAAGGRPRSPFAGGVFARYRALVGSASEGAVLGSASRETAVAGGPADTRRRSTYTRPSRCSRS